MIHFNTIMIISAILFFLGWGVVVLAFILAKNKKIEKWTVPICLLGITIVAISAGCLVGASDYQRELLPKKFPAKEYTMETVVENNDTTYVITKIAKSKSK